MLEITAATVIRDTGPFWRRVETKFSAKLCVSSFKVGTTAKMSIKNEETQGQNKEKTNLLVTDRTNGSQIILKVTIISCRFQRERVNAACLYLGKHCYLVVLWRNEN